MRTNPFPGVDPYAEAGELWPELHNPVLTYVRDALRPLLPEHYVARLELRIYTDRSQQDTELAQSSRSVRRPDLEVVRRGATPATAGTATLAQPMPGYWFTATPVERKEIILTIRSRPDRELVTAVELLSPSNKLQGSGREKYLAKQEEFLAANVNLVELDLLRGGLPTVAAQPTHLAQLPPYDYVMCVHRAARPYHYWLGPWTVRDAIPPLPVPLGEGEDELLVPLQELYDRAHENADVRADVDYRRSPVPPFRPEDAAWADSLLRAAGLRGGGDA